MLAGRTDPISRRVRSGPPAVRIGYARGRLRRGGRSIASLVLRKDQGGIGPDAHIAAKGHHVVIAAEQGPEIVPRLVGETGAVAAPVSVEPHPPQAASG